MQLTKEREDNKHISPPIVVTDVQRSVELVTILILAILARRGRIAVIEITPERIHKIVGPLATSLARGWVKNIKLVTLASDDKATDGEIRNY